MTLAGKKVALLVAPRGTEEPEFVAPKEALGEAGAAITVVGLSSGEARTVNGDLDPGGTYPIDTTVETVSAEDYDALVVPGGTVGADKLRSSKAVVALVKAFVEAGKPVGVICHGPWTLVEAGVVRGRTLTSYPSLRTDIENAGGTWVDQEVAVSDNLVTSRNPGDLPAFCTKLVELIGAG